MAETSNPPDAHSYKIELINLGVKRLNFKKLVIKINTQNMKQIK